MPGLPKSLRARLLAAIVLALPLSFAAGAGLATWQAVSSVRTELMAALASARASVFTAVTAASASDGLLKPGELKRIIAAFYGNRHIRAGLGGAPATMSRLALPRRTPGWFLAAISPALPPAIPGRCAACRSDQAGC